MRVSLKDKAIQDAEGWLAIHKALPAGDEATEALRMAAYWMSEALRFAREPSPVCGEGY